MIMPDPSIARETIFWEDGLVVVGVDSVGLGPGVVGPVACAVVWDPSVPPIAGVRDSKKLSPARREQLALEIMAQALVVGVAAASASEVDRLNIRVADHLAMTRAVRRVGKVDAILVDGLRVPALELLAPTTAIVRGDALVYSIAAASIIAKVIRDRLMARLALRYPEYGWERNAGYLTPEHLAAIRCHGVTPHHRRTFGPIRAVLEAATA
jgi:ribonuclease HII